MCPKFLVSAYCRENLKLQTCRYQITEMKLTYMKNTKKVKRFVILSLLEVKIQTTCAPLSQYLARIVHSVQLPWESKRIKNINRYGAVDVAR
jgi:hypothetical protein